MTTIPPAQALPSTMRSLQAATLAIDGIELVEKPVPTPRRGEILVRIHAASLNYRDLAILTEDYMPSIALPYVPASDACGVVAAVGEGVTQWRVGERVVPIYTQGWHDGLPTLELRTKRTLGAPLAGVLQDYLVVPEEDAVRPPASLDDAQAATLPIAALTAWSTLVEGGVKPGATVLAIGTGGVALFALQFAKAAGATVVVVSSSDEKLQKAAALGADAGINYRTHTDWDRLVKEATGGRGADIVVETGGATLGTSLAAASFGGFIGVVGFVAGYRASIGVRQLIGPMVRVQGIAVGSRARFEAMNRAVDANGIEPVIDSRFALADGAAAFAHLKSGAHFGKVVVTL